MRRVYFYQKDPQIAHTWQKMLPEDFFLQEVNYLEELFFITSSDAPALLLISEGDLSFNQLILLNTIVSSFQKLKVLVFATFENLKWCVEALKAERVYIEPSPSDRGGFFKYLNQYLSDETPLSEPEPIFFKDLLDKTIEKNLNEHVSLTDASRRFSYSYVDKIIHLCGCDVKKAARYLSLPETEIKKVLV